MAINKVLNLILGVIQIKPTLRYYFIPIRLAKIKTIDNTKCGEDEKQQALEYTAGGNANK